MSLSVSNDSDRLSSTYEIQAQLCRMAGSQPVLAGSRTKQRDFHAVALFGDLHVGRLMSVNNCGWQDRSEPKPSNGMKAGTNHN